MRLLDSAQAGERQGAFLACERMLKADGMSWGDLSRQIESLPSSPRRKSSTDEAAWRAKAERAEQRRAEMQATSQRLREELKTATADNRRLRHELHEIAEQRDRIANLHRPDNRREAVLGLLREGGRSDRAIAREVGVSPQTVGNLRRRLDQDRTKHRRS